MAREDEGRAMDVAFLTIAELNRLYRQRELSPLEVTKALLARIAAHDGKLYSFLRLTEDVALREAAEAERELMAGHLRGPMHGIPYALKDIVETAGILTTGHSKLRQEYVPSEDAELLKRLKAGGGILMGKLATWEFALGGPSFDLPWPPARNPWNPDHLPGGSSHPDVAPAIDAAVAVLRDLGAEIEPMKLSSLRDYTDCKTTISSVELFAIHEHDLRTRPQDFGRILRNRVLPGALIRGEDYLEALRWRTALAQEQARALRSIDAFVTAASLNVADRADPNAPDRLVSAPSITMPFSVGGLPAIAIPCGFSKAEGLPLSLQIAAAPFAEATVLRIAHAYQQATDWHKQHPSL